MLLSSVIARRVAGRHAGPLIACRQLLTLAIETSCDDTSVAILEKHRRHSGRNVGAEVHHHAKVTSNNLAHKGINAVVALESHQQNCASLVEKALLALPKANASNNIDANESIRVRRDGNEISVRKPDLICATRGPGMRSNLQIGHELAKGLSVAWQRPFVGVHHMHAHLLTPRLVSAMSQGPDEPLEPDFPFFTLLVSGGHTDLVHTKSLFDHMRLASTSDNAIGNALDRIARLILPADILDNAKTVMYGPLLEKFAAPGGEDEHHYVAPATRQEELNAYRTQWEWPMPVPLSDSKRMEYSFAGIIANVTKIMAERDTTMSDDERVAVAREAMRACFEHLATRLVLGLRRVHESNSQAPHDIDSIVVSGGVAANQFLKHVLRRFLDARGFSHVKLVFPPIYLCTDNAVMIGWAGMESFEAGYESTLGCMALRQWSLDPNADDGGILGVPGWQRQDRKR